MIRTSLAALLASLPALALAQAPVGALDAARGARELTHDANARLTRAADEASAPEPAPAAAEEAPLELGSEALQPEGTAIVSGDAGPAVPAPDTYTVRRGDTLWDLSGRFLNSPWYWPKLWSYNPHIENPHWIYPGNLLRFYPGSEEGPARVEAAELAELDAPPGDENLDAPRELEDFSRAELGAAPVDDDAVAVAGPYKIGYVAPRALLVRHDSFVTKGELEQSGALTASFHEKRMLSTLDEAYAQFRGDAPVTPGETYVLYRTDREIHHPVSGELLGYQSVVLGAARVVKVDDRAATLVITQAFEPIERGAMLGPWTERFVRPVARKPNARALDGRIVASQVSVVTQVGEHHVVFIDRGRDDGVEEGNLFQVVRSGDPSGKPIGAVRWDERLPRETVGDLVIIDVKPNASAALVTRSVGELAIGDRVEMRAEAAAGAM